MKKVLAILLAGMMTATAFAGCSGGDTKSSGAGGESKAADGSKADASAAAATTATKRTAPTASFATRTTRKRLRTRNNPFRKAKASPLPK